MKAGYKPPVVVMLVYVASVLVAVFALFAAMREGAGGLALLVPAAEIYLVAYALELLSRILHELGGVRAQLEGTVSVAPPPAEEADYYLQVNQKPTGPYPLKVLLNRLQMGTLMGNAMVRRVDGGNWVPLETLQT